MEEENKNFGATQQDQAPERQEKKESFFKEIIKFVLLAAVIVLPIRFFIAQPFIVSGGSMDPTFANGQYLIVDEISYRFKNPKRGDVIIFRYPLDAKKFFIKRIIGLPLETIEIRGGKALVDGKEGKKTLALEEPYIDSKIDLKNYGPTALKADEYFVMGDNRTESFDSRYWGPLKRPFIVGKPFARLFPITKMNLSPGASVPRAIEAGQAKI